jgi:hypothetical protein
MGVCADRYPLASSFLALPDSTGKEVDVGFVGVLRTPTNPTIHQVFTLNPEEPVFLVNSAK